MGTKTKATRTTAPKADRKLSGPTRNGFDLPLYLQVALTLKEEIVSGEHPMGAQLPTEDELCARFLVSRFTVREALRRLRDEGLVVSRQGSGTVVIPSPTTDRDVLQSLSINDLIAFAKETRFDIDSTRMVSLGAKVASRVGVPPGEDWLSVRGFKFGEDQDTPICWTEYYINRDFAAVGRMLGHHHGAIFPLIEDMFGQTIAEVHQEVAAAIISPGLADRFKMKKGAAALVVRRTYKTADGRTAQVTLNTHPATRFSHNMIMRRVKG